MEIIDHGGEPLDEWRPGVLTRMLASALTGAENLCVFEQFCEPGRGAPTHRHVVEEMLAVVAGEAEIWIDGERAALTTGQSVVVAPGRRHGFRNTGLSMLHVRATLAAPVFEAWFDGEDEPRRRWLPASVSSLGTAAPEAPS